MKQIFPESDLYTCECGGPEHPTADQREFERLDHVRSVKFYRDALIINRECPYHSILGEKVIEWGKNLLLVWR